MLMLWFGWLFRVLLDDGSDFHELLPLLKVSSLGHHTLLLLLLQLPLDVFDRSKPLSPEGSSVLGAESRWLETPG